jgi:hypothetical protein
MLGRKKWSMSPQESFVLINRYGKKKWKMQRRGQERDRVRGQRRRGKEAVL